MLYPPIYREGVTNAEGAHIVEHPGVVIPPGRVNSAKWQTGLLSSVIEVTYERFARLQLDQVFRGLLKRGREGGYVILDKVPEHMLPKAQRNARKIDRLRTENERLKSRLDTPT
jgi:hypothetical protein